MAQLWRALEPAEESGDPLALLHAYVSLTDVLMMLGRPREAARIGERGLEAVRRYGIDSTLLVANSIEALLATGEWDKADSLSAAALRAITANFPYMLLMLRADLELAAATSRPRGHTSTPRSPRCARTVGRGSTTSSSQSSRCGSCGG